MIAKEDKGRASSRVVSVAEKLERHIRSSGLRPGDRYITAEEGGQLLGERVMAVQRAMALLASKGILERRPRAGTFIGNAAAGESLNRSCVHFMLPEQFIKERQSQEVYWNQINGIRSVLPHVSIQFNFIVNQDVGMVKQLVEQASVGNTLLGVILILSSRPVRSFFNHSAIPTVVEGAVEPDLGNLCWICSDQAQTGRLLSGYLFDKGYRRLTTVMRDIWSIGEHTLHDGISQAMSERGLAANSLLIRSSPPEKPAIAELTRGLLADTNERTGIICRTEFQADCVSEVIAEMGAGDRAEVVLCNGPTGTAKCKYTCVVPVIDDVEQGIIAGNMLKDLTQTAALSARGQDIPVKLKTLT